MHLNRLISACALAAATAVAACGNNDNKRSDSALQTDLSLAAQQNQAHLDSISALEANNATAAPNGTNALRAPATTVRRTTTASSAPRRRTASRSTSSGSSGGTVTTTTSGGDVVVKHTKRDAAIGAAAGAVIGATTSRSKVKGGLIGAAVGGILGGVIGNNVDKQKKPPM
jgi:hypothetical protein